MTKRPKTWTGAKPVWVVPDMEHYGMFRLEWRDGSRSADCYNAARAADMLRRYPEYKAGTAMGGTSVPSQD
jgi:hypothetical protein